MANPIKGRWRDKTATVIVQGQFVNVLSSFFLIDTDDYRHKQVELMETQTESGPRHTMPSTPNAASQVTLYKRPDSPEIYMFRWTNGIDMSLEVTDLAEAKQAVEAMLQVEGVSYA